MRSGVMSLAALSAMSMLLSTSAQSRDLAPPALRVIDAGPAVPLSVYTGHLIAGVDQPGVLEGMTFPVRSRLTTGKLLQPVHVLDARWLTQPIALLGTDPVSKRWFEAHLPALRKRAAMALVLDAASVKDFKLMQQVADGLPVAPGPDSWLEQQLLGQGVSVLPLFIGLDGIATQEVPGLSLGDKP